MRKLSFVFVLFMVAFISNSYAQLPGNPSNPHGVILNNYMCHAEWERAGDSLYYEITITTPTTFYDENALPQTVGDFQPFIQFKADVGFSSALQPGSLFITYNSCNYPYGTRTYCGVIDITGWNGDGGSNIQANYYLYTGDPNNPILEDMNLISQDDIM